LKLQEEIRHISQETAPNVDSWIVHAKAIQNDIETSKRLASSIVRQAEADEEREEGLQEQEAYVDFLTKEVSFNDQLLTALNGIQGVNESLQQAEELAIQKKIIDALHALEGTSLTLREGSSTGREISLGFQHLKALSQVFFFLGPF